MVWVDDDTPSATVWTVKQYDGADWIELGRLDITANIYIPSEGVIAWADVASAATVDLGAQASRSLRLTGTTGITGFGTAASGVRRRLRIAAGLTITHNATSLICPGAANLVLGVGDIADVESLGSGNWVVTAVQRAASLGINRGVAVASTSGSQIDFTSIPANVRRVTVLLNAVSTNGDDNLRMQIGGASIETSGYGSQAMRANGGGIEVIAAAASFLLETGGSGASASRIGSLTLENITGTTWILRGAYTNSGVMTSLGSKTITGALERLRILTTDTFDAGTINIMWEV
jgi:hypothetical protein